MATGSQDHRRAGELLMSSRPECRGNPVLNIVWSLLILVALFAALNLGWRWASRSRSLPCPSMLAWMLENRVLQRLNGTQTTLDRLDLQPGQRILEIGPGPGRLLIPAAQRVLPDGQAMGVDIQAAMAERLKLRAQRAGVSNLTVVVGDATEPHVPPASFDLVFLCTVLGEIPDRRSALAQCHRALKPLGRLSITEMAGDPHYQSRSTVRKLAEEAGFRLVSIEGGWWFFTASFIKP
jgi:SAM-dependent methyltransferase